MIKEFGTSKYYLYRHISTDNKVFYVGIGTKWKKDILENRIFYYRRAFSKFGHSAIWEKIAKSGYSVEIIFETDNKEFLFNKEIEFIKLYGKLIDNSGTLTNLYDGGDTGYTSLSTSHKNKISISKKGKKQKKEHVKKRRKTLIERYKILQFDKEGSFIKEYNCPLDASKATKRSMTHILNSVLNKVKYSKDFIWMYKLGFSQKTLEKRVLDYKNNKLKKSNGCNKIVIQYDKNHKIIKEWDSLSQIKFKLGYDKGNIVKAIKFNKIANNYFWQFKN